MFGKEKQIINALKIVKQLSITDVLVHNIAAVYLARGLGFKLHGGFGLNLANSHSLLWAKENEIIDAEVSIELDLRKIDSLKRFVDIGIISYGYLPLMITRSCPAKSGISGCKTCKKGIKLQDRKNAKFPLFCNNGTTEILNSVPLIMPQKIYNDLSLDFTIFHFSVENSVENKEKVIGFFSKNQKYEQFTYGLYIRGVK